MRSWHLPVAAAALLFAASCTTAGVTSSPSITVPMVLVSTSGAGASIGDIGIRNGSSGVELVLHLNGLPPGDHGFHLHGTASCEAAANAQGQMTPAGGAGGHFDPANTSRHEGPSGMGHMGDLPLLHVGADGSASQTLTAPRFHSFDELRGHALVIHAGGDNYSDTPAPLGGGGARIACGVVS